MTRYLTEDHLGSPRVVTDRQGSVISRRDFMPFGEEIGAGVGGRTESLKYSVNGSDNIRKRFTGYEKDEETGLDFAEARMYQNKHGRFTAPDPLLSSASLNNPQTFNRYVYVGNNPVNLTDPSGLDWCWKKGMDSAEFRGPNTSCNSDEQTVTQAVYDGTNTARDSRGLPIRSGDLVNLHSDGRVTVVLPWNRPDAPSTSAQVQNQSNPGSTQTPNAPTGEVGTAVNQTQPDPNAVDLSCPEGSDPACGSGNTVNQSLVEGASADEVLDAAQTTLDVAGQIPGLGEPADAASGLISLARGDTTGAALSLSSMIPFVGNVAGGTKLARRLSRGGRYADEVADATRALCFLAGTLIHTDRGIVPIEEIKSGDTVLSYNEANGALEYREVVRLFRNTADAYLGVHIEGESQTLQVTLGHPFYVHRNRSDLSADDGDWIAAESLKTGDLLRDSAGEWKPIIAIERVAETRATFNFEVEGNHNYFVGLGGWLVHNDCTDIAMGLQTQVGGGRVIRIQQFLPNGQAAPLNAGSMYPGSPGFFYHDVFVYKGKVIDKMSKFGDKPVPFKQWVRTFDPRSAKNPEGVPTILTRIN